MELIFAYIDPGSGSLIIQAVIAGLVAIPVLFRHQLARIVRTLRGREEPTSGSAHSAAAVDTANGQDDANTGA